MDLNLQGKSVLVTGSSRGIGKAIAEAFIREGAQVGFNGRNSTELQRVVSAYPPHSTTALIGDVTKPELAKDLISGLLTSFGKLDVLICNVGSGRSVPPGSEGYSDWIRMFEVNFLSASNIIEASREALALTRGSIVCISSICGSSVIPSAPLPYSAAKAALNSYVRGSSRPLGALGIRINAIAPGNILFSGSIWQKMLREDPSSVHSMLNNHVSLARLGNVADVANLALWLSSDLASFCTGSVYTTDGGQILC